MTKIVQDSLTLADSKILRDDEQYLVIKAVVMSEIVHQYSDGWAYKPADELEKATLSANHRPITILKHPSDGIVRRRSQVYGSVENPVFRKDLNDPKTNRPCRRGTEAELWFYRDKAPEVKAGTYRAISEKIADSIRKGTLKDNSIGFTCEIDETKGEFQGKKYDYVQREIFIDHLAAPIERGRCSSPYCGLAVDAVTVGDPWEENEETIRSGHKNSDDYEGIKTVEITDGIKALVGCPKGKLEGDTCSVAMETVSFLFDKTKFTVEQAKAWFEKHQTENTDSLKAFYDCPVCRRIDEIGMLEVGKRLFKQYGADVLEVIEGHALPTKPTDEERAKAHFKLTDEEWNALSEEEKQALIAKLPSTPSSQDSKKTVRERNIEEVCLENQQLIADLNSLWK